MLARSEPFPASVLAYREGAVPPALVKQIRDGLMRAHKTAGGRVLLGTWRLKAFEAVTPAYETDLAAIMKAYPPPAPPK